MKRVLITVTILFFSTSFCVAQNLKQEAEKEKERKEMEQRAIREKQQQQEVAYQNAIESAQRNVEQQHYEQAKANYKTALGIKPEKSAFIKSEIDKIDKLIAAKEAEERETKYAAAITSAQRNVEYNRYELAREDYLIALRLKPENADYLNEQIENIDRFIADKIEKENQRIAAQKREQEVAERERLYLEAIASAERNAKQGRYEHAKDDYRDARNLKPENAAFVNQKIADLDKPATLYVYRKGMVDGFWTPMRLNILLENTLITSAPPNWKTILTVNTFDTKTVSATIYGKTAEVRINVEPGGIYYISSWVAEGKPVLRLEDKSKGKNEYDSIKEK